MVFHDERIGLSSQIAFSPTANELAVTTGYRASAAFLIDIQNGNLIHTFNPYSSYDVLFTADNRSLIVVDWSGFHVWDIPSGERIFRRDYPMGSVSAALSTDGEILAVSHSGGPSAPIRLYETANWNGLAGFGFFTVGTATSVAVSPDNRTLASGHCDRVALWDISTQERLNNLDGDSEPDLELPLVESCVEQVEFAADNSMLVASDRDVIHFWTVPDYEFVRTIPGRRFALDRHTEQMAVISNGGIQLWDLPHQGE